MPFENDPSTPLVDQYRAWAEAQGHDLAGRTNRELTKHIGDQYRSQGYSTSQIGEVYGNDFKHAYLDIENAPEPGREGVLGSLKDAWAGLEKGTSGMISTMYGAGGLAADFAGLGFAEDALMDKAAEWSEAAAEGGPSIARASDVRWDRPAEVARFLTGGFGEAAPSVAEAVGSFYLGGGLGYQVAKQGMKKRLKETVSKTIMNRAEREAPAALAEVFAKAGRRGFQTGSSVGIGLSSFGMNMGEIYNELHPYSQLDPSHPDYVSPDDARNLSITYGGYAGSLDFASAGALLNKVLRIGAKPAETYLRRLAQNLPAGVFVEGTTEAAQEFLSLAAEKYAKGEVLELTDEELNRMFDAGVLGALGGGQFAMFGSAKGPKRKEEAGVPPPTSIEPETPLLERQEDLEKLLSETPDGLKGLDIEIGDSVEQALGVKGTVKSVQGERAELEIEGEAETVWVNIDTLGPQVRSIAELAQVIKENEADAKAGELEAQLVYSAAVAELNLRSEGQNVDETEPDDDETDETDDVEERKKKKDPDPKDPDPVELKSETWTPPKFKGATNLVDITVTETELKEVKEVFAALTIFAEHGGNFRRHSSHNKIVLRNLVAQGHGDPDEFIAKRARVRQILFDAKVTNESGQWQLWTKGDEDLAAKAAQQKTESRRYALTQKSLEVGAKVKYQGAEHTISEITDDVYLVLDGGQQVEPKEVSMAIKPRTPRSPATPRTPRTTSDSEFKGANWVAKLEKLRARVAELEKPVAPDDTDLQSARDAIQVDKDILKSDAQLITIEGPSGSEYALNPDFKARELAGEFTATDEEVLALATKNVEEARQQALAAAKAQLKVAEDSPQIQQLSHGDPENVLQVGPNSEANLFKVNIKEIWAQGFGEGFKPAATVDEKVEEFKEWIATNAREDESAFGAENVEWAWNGQFWVPISLLNKGKKRGTIDIPMPQAQASSLASYIKDTYNYETQVTHKKAGYSVDYKASDSLAFTPADRRADALDFDAAKDYLAQLNPATGEHRELGPMDGILKPNKTTYTRADFKNRAERIEFENGVTDVVKAKGNISGKGKSPADPEAFIILRNRDEDAFHEEFKQEPVEPVIKEPTPPKFGETGVDFPDELVVKEYIAMPGGPRQRYDIDEYGSMQSEISKDTDELTKTHVLVVLEKTDGDVDGVPKGTIRVMTLVKAKHKGRQIAKVYNSVRKMGGARPKVVAGTQPLRAKEPGTSGHTKPLLGAGMRDQWGYKIVGKVVTVNPAGKVDITFKDLNELGRHWKINNGVERMATMKAAKKFKAATNSRKWLQLYKELVQGNFIDLLAEPIKAGKLTKEGKALNAKGVPEYVTSSNISAFRKYYEDTPEMFEAVNKAYDASIKKLQVGGRGGFNDTDVSFNDMLEHERVVSETWALKFNHYGKSYVLEEILTRIRTETEKNEDGSDNVNYIDWESPLAKAALEAASDAEAPSYLGGSLIEGSGTAQERLDEHDTGIKAGGATALSADPDEEGGGAEVQSELSNVDVDESEGVGQAVETAASQNLEKWLKKGPRGFEDMVLALLRGHSALVTEIISLARMDEKFGLALQDTKIYEVLVDMYQDAQGGDVWVVDDVDQANAQLVAIQQGAGGGTNFSGITEELSGDWSWNLPHRNPKKSKKIYERGQEPKNLTPAEGKVKGEPYTKSGSESFRDELAMDLGLSQDAPLTAEKGDGSVEVAIGNRFERLTEAIYGELKSKGMLKPYTTTINGKEVSITRLQASEEDHPSMATKKAHELTGNKLLLRRSMSETNFSADEATRRGTEGDMGNLRKAVQDRFERGASTQTIHDGMVDEITAALKHGGFSFSQGQNFLYKLEWAELSDSLPRTADNKPPRLETDSEDVAPFTNSLLEVVWQEKAGVPADLTGNWTKAMDYLRSIWKDQDPAVFALFLKEFTEHGTPDFTVDKGRATTIPDPTQPDAEMVERQTAGGVLSFRMPYNTVSPVDNEVVAPHPLVVDAASAAAAAVIARQQGAVTMVKSGNPMDSISPKTLADNRLAVAEFADKLDPAGGISLNYGLKRALTQLGEPGMEYFGPGASSAKMDPAYNKALREMASSLIGSKALAGINIRFVGWEEFRKYASVDEDSFSAAVYLPAAKEIVVSELFWDGGKDGNAGDALLSAIIHEAIHVPTKMALDVGYAFHEGNAHLLKEARNHNLSLTGQELGDAYGALTETLIPFLREQTKRGHYGLTSPDEFWSELGSNAGFRKFLRDTKLDAATRRKLGIRKASWIRTVWDWAVNLLARLIPSIKTREPELLRYAEEQLSKVLELSDRLAPMGKKINRLNVRGIKMLSVLSGPMSMNYKEGQEFKWIDNTKRNYIDDTSAKIKVPDPSAHDGFVTFEGSDAKHRMLVPNNYYKLTDLIDHPKLFSAYPELANTLVYVRSRDTNETSRGSYWTNNPETIRTVLDEVRDEIESSWQAEELTEELTEAPQFYETLGGVIISAAERVQKLNHSKAEWDAMTPSQRDMAVIEGGFAEAFGDGGTTTRAEYTPVTGRVFKVEGELFKEEQLADLYKSRWEEMGIIHLPPKALASAQRRAAKRAEIRVLKGQPPEKGAAYTKVDPSIFADEVTLPGDEQRRRILAAKAKSQSVDSQAAPLDSQENFAKFDAMAMGGAPVFSINPAELGGGDALYVKEGELSGASMPKRDDVELGIISTIFHEIQHIVDGIEGFSPGTGLGSISEIKEQVKAVARLAGFKDSPEGTAEAAAHIRDEITDLIYSQDSKSQDSQWGKRFLLDNIDGFMDVVQALHIWSEDNNLLGKPSTGKSTSIWQGYRAQAGETTARFTGASATGASPKAINPDLDKSAVAGDILDALQKWARGTTPSEAMLLGINDPGELKPSREELEARINLYNGVWQLPSMEVLFQMRTMLKRRAAAIGPAARNQGGRTYKGGHSAAADFISGLMVSRDEGAQFSEKGIPSGDDNAQVQHEADAAGLNELKVALTSVFREISDLTGNMDISEFVDKYGKLSLGWGSKSIATATKAIEGNLKQFGVEAGDLRIVNAGLNKVARFWATRKAVSYLEKTRLAARTAHGDGVNSLAESNVRIATIKRLFSSLQKRKFESSEELATGVLAKIVDMVDNHDRLSRYRSIMPKQGLTQAHVKSLLDITSEQIAGAMRSLVVENGILESSKAKDILTFIEASRSPDLAFLQGDDVKTKLKRVAFVTATKNSGDYYSILRLSMNRIGVEQQDFLTAGEAVIAAKDKSELNEVSGKFKGKVGTKLKELIKSKKELLVLEGSLGVTQRDIKINNAIDAILGARSTRLRQAMGELEPTDIRDGATIITMREEAGEWIEGRFKVEFGSGGKLKNKAKFLKANRDTLRYLRLHPGLAGSVKYDMMKEQAELALQVPVVDEWFNVRRSSFLAGLESTTMRFAKMGYHGKRLAGMTSQTVALHRDLSSEMIAHGKRFSYVYNKLIAALDISGEAFYEGMYQEMFWWLDNHPEYYGKEDEAFSALWKRLKKSPNIPHPENMTGATRRILRDFLDKTLAARDHERQVNMKLGNRVKDDEIKVQSFIDGEMVDFYRMPLDMGHSTIPRSLNNARITSTDNYMKKAGWAASIKDMESIKLIGEWAAAGDHAMIAEKGFGALFDEEIMREFVKPHVTTDVRKTVFYGPPEEGSDRGEEVANSFVDSAWVESGGDLKAMLDLIYEARISEPTDKGRAEWYYSFIRQLHKRYSYLSESANRVRMNRNESGLRGSEAMMNAPRSLDARQIESRLPRQFFRYEMYDEVSSNIRLATHVAVSVFGRDGANASAAYKEGRHVLDESKSLFDTVMSEATRSDHEKPRPRTVLRPNGYTRAELRKAHEILERKGHDDPKNKLQKLYTDSVLHAELKHVFSELGKYYGKGNDAGPYKDAGTLLEILGTETLLVLNNPKSSFWQGMSMMEFPLAFRGLNKWGIKGTGHALANFFNQSFGGIIEAMGVQLERTGTYAQNLNNTHYRMAEMDLPFKVYNSMTGNGAELTNAHNPKRYIRTLKNVMSHNRKHGTGSRSPVDALTPIKGMFHYINNIVNHSVGVASNFVYQDLVIEAAKYIEDHNITAIRELDPEELGLGKGMMEWVVGEKDGWNHATNMLVDAGAPSLSRLAFDYVDRKRMDKNAPVLERNTQLFINHLGMNNMSGEGFNSKPSWLYTNDIMKHFGFFLGWPLGKMARDNKFIFRGDQDSVRTYMAFMKYLGLMSAVYMPIGLSFAFLIDWYDEEVLDKPNNLPPVTPWAMLPVLGIPLAMRDENFTLYSITSRLARAGTPYGMGFDVANTLMSKGDPYGAGRDFSLDSRIFAFSMFKNIIDALGNWMHQGEFDWGNVGRPISYGMGGNSVIQMMDAVTNILDIDSTERRLANYIGVRNYVKKTAWMMGLELRPPSKGYGRPNAVGVNVKQMERAAYANDTPAFLREYKQAVEAAREHLAGRKESPEKYVIGRFKQRNLRIGITQGKISDTDWARLLEILPEDIRSRIIGYESSHNTYLRMIGGQYGRSSSKYTSEDIRRFSATGELP